jgi:hypothetical protein
MSLHTIKTELVVGDTFSVDVLLDTEQDMVNAIEASIDFPEDLLHFERSEEKNSTLSLWVKRPEVRENGVLHFSGVAPGGREGGGLVLTRLFFTAHSEGQSVLSIVNPQVLKHDGFGTILDTAVQNIHISVQNGDGNASRKLPLDTEPPEVFTPLRVQDPDMFDNKYFLIFETQDKGSGIEHYMVKEGFFDYYKQAQSPHLLSRQTDDRVITVKAVDRAGNKRIATIYPQYDAPWHQQPKTIFSILIGTLALCSLLFLYKLFRGEKLRT